MSEENTLVEQGIELSYLEKSIFSEYIEEGEKIIYIVKKHIWFILIPFFKWGLLFFPFSYATIYFKSNPYIFLASLAVALTSFTLFTFDWYNWYADVFILTDQNVIFIQWDSIVRLRSARIAYTEIESASIEMEGFMPTVFGFGNIKIETANESLSHRIIGATKVREAEQKILENKSIYAKKQAGGENEAHIFKQALREILDEYLGDTSKFKKNNENINLEEYEIRGPRFHQTEEADVVIDQADLKEDRFEKYRLKDEDFQKLDFPAEKKVEEVSEREKIKQRFDKYRLKPEDLEI